MSLSDILAGRQPLFRSTGLRRAMRTIEQDYADLTSRSGGLRYLDSCRGSRYVRETGPTFDDIAAPRDSLHQDAVDTLLADSLNPLTNICFVTLVLNPVGGAKSDIPCQFPFPVNRISIASMTAGTETNSVYMSLAPVNKYPPAGNPAGSGVTGITGFEQWFDMRSYITSTTFQGKVVRLAHSIDLVYFTFGFENGGGNHVVTILGSKGEVLETSATNMGG